MNFVSQGDPCCYQHSKKLSGNNDPARLFWQATRVRTT